MRPGKAIWEECYIEDSDRETTQEKIEAMRERVWTFSTGWSDLQLHIESITGALDEKQYHLSGNQAGRKSSETGGLGFSEKSLDFEKANIVWPVGDDQSAVPVIIYAFGPKADMFTGVYDNTDVAKKLASVMGIKHFPKVIK